MNITAQRVTDGTYNLNVTEAQLKQIEIGLESAAKQRERARLNYMKKKGETRTNLGRVPGLTINRVEEAIDNTPVIFLFDEPVKITLLQQFFNSWNRM